MTQGRGEQGNGRWVWRRRGEQGGGQRRRRGGSGRGVRAPIRETQDKAEKMQKTAAATGLPLQRQISIRWEGVQWGGGKS